MAEGMSISSTTVGIPESLREALAVRASKNGRSVNFEIVMILQAAIDEDRLPKSVESFTQQEADKFKEMLLGTLKTTCGKDEK